MIHLHKLIDRETILAEKAAFNRGYFHGVNGLQAIEESDPNYPREHYSRGYSEGERDARQSWKNNYNWSN